ncbi:MAG: hypothetical protein U0574_08295 [Phycisphaerales bacterium]
MVGVLIANALWLVFLGSWCALYFVQRSADSKGPGRYPPYVPPAD